MEAITERIPVELPLERIRSHLALVATRDLYDPDHIDRVSALSVRLAERLGLADDDVAHVEAVAQLREVGKAMVPIAILRKEEPLEDAEWALLQRYPEHGALLVARIPCWEHLAQPVRAGNERWDGAGYPDGLAGEAIPQASRITYVAQAYLAMLADRPYRDALSPAGAIVGIARAAGSQFCPATVTALVDVLLTADPELSLTERHEPMPPPVAEPVVRASIARPDSRGSRSWRRRGSAAVGALGGALVGLAVVLPLPHVADRCPPAHEGRAICVLRDIAAPALTTVAVCAAIGLTLLGFLLVRLPEVIRRHRDRRGEARPTPAFAGNTDLVAASWGIVYDDENTALRMVGRRQWRQETS